MLVTDYQKLQARYPELRGEIQNDIDGPTLNNLCRRFRENSWRIRNWAGIILIKGSP